MHSFLAIIAVSLLILTGCGIGLGGLGGLGDLGSLSCQGYDMLGNGDGTTTLQEVKDGFYAVTGMTISDEDAQEYLSMFCQ